MTITPPMINMSKFATFQEPPTKSNNMRPGEISTTTKATTFTSTTTATTRITTITKATIATMTKSEMQV